jgi:hypothetical protein
VHKGCIIRLRLNPPSAPASDLLECDRSPAAVSGGVFELRVRFSVFGRVAFVNYPSSGRVAHVHFMSPDHAASAAGV